MSLLSVEIYENSISTYLNYDFPKQNDIPTGVASQLLQDVKRFLCGVEKSPEKKVKTSALNRDGAPDLPKSSLDEGIKALREPGNLFKRPE